MMEHLVALVQFISRFWQALQAGHVPHIGMWNYVLLFFFVMVQGPLVKMLSGAVASTHVLNLFLILAVAVSATTLMDFIWYRVGSSGKLQHYFRKHTKKRQKKVAILQSALRKHYLKVLVLGKIATGMGVPVNIAAGLSQLSWRKWLPAILIGEVIQTALLIGIGYFAAESIGHANQTIQIIGLTFTGIMLIVILIVIPLTFRQIITNEQAAAD